MRLSRATLITIGLAVVVAITAWLLSRDGGESAETAQGRSKTAKSPASRSVRPDRTRKSDADEANPRPRVEPRRFGEPSAEEPDPDDDGERALVEAKIQAFHHWRIDARRKLMGCLPAPGLGVQPHEMRVVFEPLPDPPEGVPRRLVVARFEPGPGVEDPTAFAVPGEVQKCLDQLLGSPLELPEGSTELDDGYSESIDVPWG